MIMTRTQGDVCPIIEDLSEEGIESQGLISAPECGAMIVGGLAIKAYSFLYHQSPKGLC
jgi:hypothetical protein